MTLHIIIGVVALLLGALIAYLVMRTRLATQITTHNNTKQELKNCRQTAHP